MALTRVDKERISDSRLKIQAVAESLSEIDPGKIAGMENIQECLEDAEKSLSGTLRAHNQDTRTQ